MKDDPLRNRVAYLKINCGMSLKEIAVQLDIPLKNADYYWHTAKRQIRGQKITPPKRRKTSQISATKTCSAGSDHSHSNFFASAIAISFDHPQTLMR